MNAREAMKSLLEGNKIRKSDWKIGVYLWLDGNNLRDEKGYLQDCISFNNSTWELYTEPVKPMSRDEFMTELSFLYEHGKLANDADKTFECFGRWFDQGCPVESKAVSE